MSRNLLKRIGIAVAAGLAALALFSAWMLYRAVNAPLPQPLQTYASIQLETPAGGKAPLGALLQNGAPTILSFWASWCVPCRQEAPALAQLRQKYPPDKLNILYLNIEGRAADGPAQKFLADTGAKGLPYHYINPADFKTIIKSNMIALPRSYIFNQHGTALKAFTGYTAGKTSEDLNKAIQEVVGNQDAR